MQIPVKFFKVLGLPSEPEANAFYFIFDEDEDIVDVRLTDIDGVPFATLASLAALGIDVLAGTSTTKNVTPAALAALWDRGDDIPSAGTITIPEGGSFHVTGNTGPITDIDLGTDKVGRLFWLIYDSTPTLTHGANLHLIGEMDFTVVAGERHLFMSEGSDAVTMLIRLRPDGAAYIGNVHIYSYNAGGASTTFGGSAAVALKALLPIFLQDGAGSGNTICSAADTPSQITADQNNFDFGNSRFIRLSTDATPRKITGFKNNTSIFNCDGEEHLVYVVAGEIIVSHDDSGSTDVNRVLTPHGGDLRITAGEVLKLLYDDTTDRWRASTTGDTRRVIAKDADYTVVAGDHNTIFTNAGAVDKVDFTLPDGAGCIAGKTRFTFFAVAGQDIFIHPVDTDHLFGFCDANGTPFDAQTGVPVSSAGTVGETMTVRFIGGTTWIAERMLGVWTA
jgi:hypothetical protein